MHGSGRCGGLLTRTGPPGRVIFPSRTRAWASRLLGDESVAVVWAQVQQQPRTPAGNPRPPLAAHMTTVDHQGLALLDDVIRLAGPRAAAMPKGALPPQGGAHQLNDVLGGRRLVCWTDAALEPTARRLAAPLVAVHDHGGFGRHMRPAPVA